MGLETVELIMAWESAFGITISDDIAVDLITTRDVIDYMYEHVRDKERPLCNTQTAFYALRRTMANTAHLPKGSMRVHSALGDLLPKHVRATTWKALSGDTQYHVPDLTRPWQVAPVIGLFALGAITGLFILGNSGGIALVGGLTVIVAGSVTTRPLRTHFPVGIVTMGDLARHISTGTPTGGGRWTRDEVRATVRNIIVQETGIAADFPDEAAIHKDLGIE